MYLYTIDLAKAFDILPKRKFGKSYQRNQLQWKHYVTYKATQVAQLKQKNGSTKSCTIHKEVRQGLILNPLLSITYCYG